MNKKSVKKALLLVLCAILLVVASVMGTLAYLTDKDDVTNTFTAGKVQITLTESVVNEYGVPVTPAATTPDGNEYLLVPGNNYTKNPVVTVLANSEPSWLFVKVENGIAGIEADSDKIVAQMSTNGWQLVEGQTNVYWNEHTAKSGADALYPVFDSFTIKTAWDGAGYDDAEVVLTAYAIQKANLADAKTAWAAFPNP